MSAIYEKPSGRTTTKIIAALDTPTHLKRQADYICDGVNDHVEINNAHKALLNFSNAWTHVQETPVLTGLKFPLFWFDGATYHAYGSYDNDTKIGHATSPDGITWTLDVANNPVLTVGGAGAWDNTTVAVFNPWKEGGTWYALYRGNGSKTGLATSPDGLIWTKSASNPVINYPDPAGIIKDGATYYCYTNTTSVNRRVVVWTSTNLTTWTQVGSGPIMDGDRYCSAPFKYGGKFYLLVSKYYDCMLGGVLELYRCDNPLFLEGQREFLGVVVFDPDSPSVDTPSVITDTITRDTFPGNEIKCYYAKLYGGGYPGFLAVESDIATAINKAIMPDPGKIVLLPGTYNIAGTTVNQYAIEITYGNILEGYGAELKLSAGYSREHALLGLIFVDKGSIIEGVTINGNRNNVTGNQMGITVAYGGLAKNIAVCGWTYGGADIYGKIITSNIYRNANRAFIAKEKGIIDNCNIYGNGDGTQAAVVGVNALVRDCRVFNNGCRSIDLSGAGAKVENCDIFDNGKTTNVKYGIYALVAGGIIQGCRIFGNQGYSNNAQIGGQANVRIVDCIITAGDQKYGVYLTAAAGGSVLGNNVITVGTVGTIYDEAGTITQYNNVAA
jgi:hypothetical protein